MYYNFYIESGVRNYYNNYSHLRLIIYYWPVQKSLLQVIFSDTVTAQLQHTIIIIITKEPCSGGDDGFLMASYVHSG